MIHVFKVLRTVSSCVHASPVLVFTGQCARSVGGRGLHSHLVLAHCVTVSELHTALTRAKPAFAGFTANMQSSHSEFGYIVNTQISSFCIGFCVKCANFLL